MTKPALVRYATLIAGAVLTAVIANQLEQIAGRKWS